MPKKVTKKLIHDRKVCAEKIHRGENVCDGETVLEDMEGRTMTLKCGCVCHATKNSDTKSDKFKTSPFAKKYKEELIRHEDRLGEWYETRQDTSPLNKKVMGSSSLEGFGCVDDIIESANQVKSWNRSPISETVNVTYLFLAFIIGFSVCAIVVTPLVINSI